MNEFSHHGPDEELGRFAGDGKTLAGRDGHGDTVHRFLGSAARAAHHVHQYVRPSAQENYADRAS